MKKTNHNLSIRILNWRDIHHPLAGGAEISLHEHAKYWIQKGASVTWHSASWKGAKRNEVVDGITIQRMGNHMTVHFMFFLSYLFGKVEKSNVTIDCFHFVPFFSTLFIKKERVIALINEVAGDLWMSNMFYPLGWIGKKIEPFFFKAYKKNLFITSSDSTVHELKQLGILEKNIVIVYHGVTIEKMSPSIKKEMNPTILFLNRISKDKGIDDALSSFAELKKSISTLQLWIVGKEEYPGLLENYVRKYELSDGITYYGYVTQKKKFELMKKSWLLVHPSHKEGWGLTVIEAASQGTPTVGYDVEGLRDSIRNGKTGILITPSSRGIVQGVKELVKDKKKLADMGKNCIDWSSNFSWQKAGEKSWEVICGA